MEGGRREELKSPLSLVSDIVVLLHNPILRLVALNYIARLKLASNCLQNPRSGKAVKWTGTFR